ncbi:DUF1738 domain-containing protein [Acidipila sp. EB88]|nr:DUF1738 domain-containing protein [Acidipila sp. EB88]
MYETVTARILASLKAGVVPWSKPWRGNSKGTAFPSNYRTGAPYRGINVLLLWGSPYASNYWLTFKQAQELGGTVRKGEKGTPIVFWKKLAVSALGVIVNGRCEGGVMVNTLVGAVPLAGLPPREEVAMQILNQAKLSLTA